MQQIQVQAVQALRIPPEKMGAVEHSVSQIVKNAFGENKYMNSQAGARCDGLFASSKGLGSVGAAIFEKVTEYPNLMSGPSDVAAICPRFNSTSDRMSTAEKAGFYVLLFEGMSAIEASCKVDAVNPGATKGVAYGLFQLHEDKETESGGDMCQIGISRSPVGSALCAVSDLSAQFARSGGRLFEENNTQWQVLHPNEHRHTYIAAILNSYGPCQYSSDDPNL